VVTLAEVMDRGLYYEDVQQIAREHGLPISRSKDELIDELVNSGELEPEEVVGFVGVDTLRVMLQEIGLPSGATRDVLAARLVKALSPRPPPKRTPRRSNPKASPPKSELEHPAQPEEAPSPVPPTPITVQVNVPLSPPPLVQVHLPKPERPSAAWGFAGILMTGIVGATLYLGVAAWGLEGGVLAAVAGAAFLAVALLFAARWWVPWIDGLAK
jgi:hypothetical protein